MATDQVQLVNELCDNNGALLTQIIAWVAGTVGAASFIANFRKYLPGWLVPILDTAALNFVKDVTKGGGK